MLRRALIACAPVLLLAGGLTACATGTEAGATQVRAWALPAPYLPPPDPASSARAPRSADGDPETRPAASAETSSSVTDTAPGASASGAPTDAEVQADLRQAYGGEGGADLDQATIDGAGLAVIPQTAPRRLVALMQAANAVARKPYVYGGGHGRNPDEIWSDSAYDCSGSVSYALAAAGYLDGPMVSGALAGWGRPGPGRWVTIYANGGHAFMVVAGLRFDTSGRQSTGTRWQSAGARSYSGFTVRHPPGL